MKPNKKNTINLVNYVNLAVAAVTKAETSFPLATDAITPQTKRHTVKVRKGSEGIIREIAQLVKTQGLDSSSLHSEDMLKALDNVAALAPLKAIVDQLAARIDDARYTSSISAWQMALQFYSLLQTRSLVDTKVANALEPITAFFSYRHELVNDAKPTKLQTRMNTKLRDAERLAARSKPRASVIAAENAAPPTTPTVSSPAPQPQPVAAPAVAAPQPVAAPAAVVMTPQILNGSNGITNGAHA